MSGYSIDRDFWHVNKGVLVGNGHLLAKPFIFKQRAQARLDAFSEKRGAVYMHLFLGWTELHTQVRLCVERLPSSDEEKFADLFVREREILYNQWFLVEPIAPT